MASSEILELVQFELSNARNMAEHADDGFLLYLIDMAILEVKRKVCLRDTVEKYRRRSENVPNTATVADREACAAVTAPRPEALTAPLPNGRAPRGGRPA